MASFSGSLNLMGFKGAKVFSNLDEEAEKVENVKDIYDLIDQKV